MSALHITRGLPGSGKTTFARAWVAQDPTTRVRVNRDDVRQLIHQPYAHDATEHATTTGAHAMIRAFLRGGRDVIVDDTNLTASFVKRLLRIAEQTGSTVEWHDFLIHPDVAKQRDQARGGKVGTSVIDRFARRLGPGGELPPRPDVAAVNPRSVVQYVAKPGTAKAVIVDIDGTLAINDGHRSPYDMSKVLSDATNIPVKNLLWDLVDLGYTPVIMTGRDESAREDTIKWLADRIGLGALDYAGPFMRAIDDRRDDALIKLELFDAHVRDEFDVSYVLDDRNRVVRAWRSIGLTVLQVADGDF